ncbi:MAG: DUF4153 domain-containing protein [Holosporaceae bacterium]|nr:DUF4153 domain-containing protein [Holosporaceae bacterium]
MVHEDPSTEATQKLPKERMFRKKSIDPMRDINFIRNALNYVVIPFLLTYSVILYMYIVQIIFKQSLPEGIVATLVCIFGDIGIATYLVGYRFKNYNKVFSFFTSNFFKIFLMPTFMLAIAIGLRIDEYGITISRYMIVISFIWFQICIFSSFFLKEECVGQCIVTSLALLIIASSFPRIGAVDVSEWSRKCKWDKWEQKMV